MIKKSSLVTEWRTKEEWEAALAGGRANPLRLKPLASQQPVGDGKVQHVIAHPSAPKKRRRNSPLLSGATKRAGLKAMRARHDVIFPDIDYDAILDAAQPEETK